MIFEYTHYILFWSTNDTDNSNLRKGMEHMGSNIRMLIPSMSYDVKSWRRRGHEDIWGLNTREH